MAPKPFDKTAIIGCWVKRIMRPFLDLLTAGEGEPCCGSWSCPGGMPGPGPNFFSVFSINQF